MKPATNISPSSAQRTPAILFLLNFFIPILLMNLPLIDQERVWPLVLNVTVPMLVLEIDGVSASIGLILRAALYLLSIYLLWMPLYRTFDLIRTPSPQSQRGFMIGVGCLAVFANSIAAYYAFLTGQTWLVSSTVTVFAGILLPVIGSQTISKASMGILLYLFGYTVVPLVWT